MLEMLIGKLTGLMGPIQSLSKDKRELKDNALRSISHALNETYIYYNSQSKGKPRNNDTERQLSNYWAAAAIPIRHIDEDVAMICEYKAEYWINPEHWDNEKIEQHGIGLDRLRRMYRTRLAPRARKPRIEPTFT